MSRSRRIGFWPEKVRQLAREAQDARALIGCTMQHVLGVAYPHLDRRGQHSTELELGLLRLAFAVHSLQASGETACGLMVVLRQEIRDEVRKMKARYSIGEEVRVVFASLLVSDMTRLSEASESVEMDGRDDEAVAIARDIALAALEREVRSSQPGVTVVSELHLLPFGVRWDYYGVVSSSDLSVTGDPSCPRLF